MNNSIERPAGLSRWPAEDQRGTGGSLPGTILKRVIFGLSIGLCLAGCKKAALEKTPSTNGSTKSNSGTTSAVIPPDFTIALLPDIQFLTEEMPKDSGGVNYGGHDGQQIMLTKTLRWIMDNRESENIVYVGGLGDITDDGDKTGNDATGTPFANQWTIAWRNFYGEKLGAPYTNGIETPYAGFPNGIPYGLAVGNHDQRPNEGPNEPCVKYNQYFGKSHFAGRAYYGGSYSSSNNNSHYQRFSVGVAPNKMDFMVIHINWDLYATISPTTGVNKWAADLCAANPNSKIIIITHYMMEDVVAAPLTAQGDKIWQAVRQYPNVFMFAGGHLTGEGYGQYTYNGKVIKGFQSDYQAWAKGGEGFFRLMKFSAANDLISVRTYSPYRDQLPSPANAGAWQTDANSQFTRPWFRSSTGVRINDFSNQGKNQLAFFNNGVWKVKGMANQTFGQAGDIPCPGDYDGDGDADMVYFRPSNATWYNIPGSAGIAWGNSNSNDIPVPADYTGDGKFDIAIWRPAEGKWYIKDKGNYAFGLNGDIPIVGDNNGDGVADFTVYRPSNKTFYRNNGMANVTFAGASSADVPVPGDYNGDGKADNAAIYRPSTGEWIISGITTQAYGQPGDIPVPGDYIGNGKTQRAIYRPSEGKLYVSDIGGGDVSGVFGNIAGGDKLLNLPYPIRKIFYP